MSLRLNLLGVVLTPFLLLPAVAQNPAPPANWERVQALPANSDLELRTDQGKRHCHLVEATADQLTCAKATYKRDQVQRVRMERRGTSVVHGLLLGTGIGVGAGLAIGAGIGPAAWTSRGRGAGVGAAAFGLAGALLGTAIGASHKTGAELIYMR